MVGINYHVIINIIDIIFNAIILVFVNIIFSFYLFLCISCLYTWKEEWKCEETKNENVKI